MKRIAVGTLSLLTVVSFAACGGEEAKEDAPLGQVDDSPAFVINNVDEYPNIAVKCRKSLGVYTTTRDGGDSVTFVGNDPNCPGYNAELPTTVGQ